MLRRLFEFLVVGAVVVISATMGAKFDSETVPNPGVSPTTCSGHNGTECANGSFGGKNIGGTFSCNASKCAYCVDHLRGCKFNGTTYACCKSGEYCNDLAAKNAKRYKIIAACTPPCQSFVKFIDSCKDKNGRVFEATYKACNGTKPNTWTYCKRGKDTPSICGATGATCTRSFAEPVDDCFPGLYCPNGTCVPECPEGNTTCKTNYGKVPCANRDSVNSLLKTCTDKDGRQFGVPGRYLRCNSTAITKTNGTWLQCHNTYNPPVECGSTGYNCSTYERIKTCCVNFKCGKNNTCEPECPADDKNCKPSLGLSACNSGTRFLNCTGKDGKVIPGYYLFCNGSKPNTMLQCPNAIYNPTPKDCPIPGSKCTKNETGVPIDDCCTGMQCNTGTCQPECSSADDKNCVYNSLKEPCSDTATSVKILNCTVNNRVFGTPARFLSCKRSKPKTWFECNALSTSTPPRECGVAGAECKWLNETVKSCCTGFECGLGKKCQPECSLNSSDCHINRAFTFCRRYFQERKNCTDSTGKSVIGEYILCKGQMPNTFVDCSKMSTPRNCGTTGFSCAADPEICCNKYKCGDNKKCGL